MAAARERGEPTDHVLLAGPPGLGKTSLAHVVAVEMGSRIHTISGPALERKGDLAAILTALEPRDVLFVDEIHRLPRAIEEILYPAMEDGAIDIVIGQGPGARTLRLDLAPFTLVGATTRAGLLTTPLRDRFGISFRLEHYGLDDLVRIVLRSARILGVRGRPRPPPTRSPRRARGTPRVANRILRRVRDVAQVRRLALRRPRRAPSRRSTCSASTPTASTAPTASTCACSRCASAAGPVGLSTLAVATGEDQGTLEEVYEPYLIQQGLIQRTPRGRILTPRGRQLAGAPPADGTLFAAG